MNKKELELLISKIQGYEFPVRRLEQYFTPTGLVAHLVWTAYMKGDIAGRSIADLGCGDGRLLIAAVLMGAKRGLCIDIDDRILTRARENSLGLLNEGKNRVVYMLENVEKLSINPVDTVIMNPPFGVYKSNRGIDLVFLEKATKVARAIYSLHKYNEESLGLIRQVLGSRGFTLEGFETHDFEIPRMYESHRRRIYRTKVMLVVARRRGVNNDS